MFGFLLKGLAWLVATMLAIGLIVSKAQAQPVTYLPWSAGHSYLVTQGNNYGGHTTVYTRYGWDFAMPHGTPVLAAAPGTVVEAGFAHGRGWGYTVTVCYGDATCSRYAHLSSIAVRSGDPVGQAQLIGRVGSTGQSTGPHLHYQLERRSSRDISIPSAFAEAGNPRTGSRPVSRNQASLGEYRGTVNAQFPMDADGVVTVTQGDGDKVPIGFNLWNNGTRTWEDARLVLVNDPPRNLRQALGWESPNSIPGDRQRVEPGSGTNVRFHVNPDDLNRPGDYPFRFRVLDRVSGEFIPGVAPSFVLRVRAGCYGASFVTQSVSPLTAAGQTGQLKVVLRNTGTCTWQRGGDRPVRLGTREPRDGAFPFADASWLSASRLAMEEAAVEPGELAHFRATFSVPPGTGAGRVRQYFAPVAEGHRWFGLRIGIFLDVYVGNADHLPFGPNDYRTPWVTQTYVDRPLGYGETAVVTVTYRNLGPAVLFDHGQAPVRLRGIKPTDRYSGFVDPHSPYAVGTQGVRLPVDRVDPGETFTFTVPIRVADGIPKGPYHEYFRPVAEGLTWFGPDDVFWPFEVR